MPANKNALIRYKTIDNCLRNRYRRWKLKDLVEAGSEVLYEMEGIDEQSKYIATKPLHRTQRQIGHNPDDGSCLFEIEVVINYEMYSIFLSLGSGVRVLQPPTAVEYMRTKTEEMAKLYR